MDIGTGLALLGSAQLAERLFGPTADYMGQGLASFAKRRVENVRRITDHMIRHLGARLNDEGGVPPRVVRALLDEGSFVEDAVAASYYGGVLASARTPQGRDDTASTYASLLSRLSVYQIRTHFVLYSVFQAHAPKDEDPSSWNMQRYQFSLASYEAAMDFGQDENARLQSILEQVLFGLAQEGMIGDFSYGPEMENELMFEPTIYGAQLFMYANGFGNRPVVDILSPDCLVPMPANFDVGIPSDARRVV